MTEEPIYEKLAPNEVFIISIDGDDLLYVTNVDGWAVVKKASVVA
jgi:hypothetical protein